MFHERSDVVAFKALAAFNTVFANGFRWVDCSKSVGAFFC